jgi:SAM-dependent methyltransferase
MSQLKVWGMVAMPPESKSPAETRESHQVREVAESFGLEAERYNRARPSYPHALAERIVAASPGRDVLDVGCGTGITGRLFQAAGCRVLGVDTDERMADLARRGGVEAEVATFESWDPAGRAFDAVIAGQAWHWVDPVAGAVKAAQVLRPGGRLAVFWNAFGFPPDLGAAFAAVYQRVIPDSPVSRRGLTGRNAYQLMCDKAADGMRQAGGFGEPEQWQFDWDRPYTRAEWLDAVPTFGGHSLLPADVRDELLAGIGAAIDAAGGGFTMHYATMAVTAERRSPRDEAAVTADRL